MRVQIDSKSGLRADQVRFPRCAAEFFAGLEQSNRIILSKATVPIRDIERKSMLDISPCQWKTPAFPSSWVFASRIHRWREFDAIYRPILFAYLRKRGLKDFDADEVVQEIFVKLLDKICTYDRTRSRFRTWLFGAAHNSLVDNARRRASYAKALDGWAVEMLHASPSDSQKMSVDFLKIHRLRSSSTR